MIECHKCEEWVEDVEPFQGVEICAPCLKNVKTWNCDVCGESYYRKEALLLQGHKILPDGGGARVLTHGWCEPFDDYEDTVAIHTACMTMWVQGALASLKFRLRDES